GTMRDVDSQESYVGRRNFAGTYGHFSINTAGAWTYSADNAHNEFKDGVTYTDTFPVTSADGTATSVTVKILGTNDAAVLSSATVNPNNVGYGAAISPGGTRPI